MAEREICFHAPRGFLQLSKIKKLYRSAFPRDERKPFDVIRKMQRAGKSDIWYFEFGGAFLGMATTINSETEVLIDYFAVKDEMRSKGYGSRMLRALLDHYQPRGVFLEIEIPYEECEDYALRLRRKNFYLRSGLSEIGTRATLFGVDMELLGVGVNFDFDAYRNFYLENYGRFAYDNIKKIVNKK